MTVPVRIGGHGPYDFLVDTGSERSAISHELARALELRAGTTVTVQSMTDARRTATVIIPTLKVGKRTVSGIHAPAYARRHLGAEGLLGVDTLRKQRVELDFVRLKMTVGPSRTAQASWPSDTIVVTAKNRFGHLMLVDAAFEGERVWVIIDTGAEVTVGNNALRRRLERRGRLGPMQRIGLISVTGGTMSADYTLARRLRIADAEIANLPVAFADVVPFRKLRLTEHPAILLGMDALRMFERISLDFATRKVKLLVPAEARQSPAFAVAGR
jgi:predicted aspartyl protease